MDREPLEFEMSKEKPKCPQCGGPLERVRDTSGTLNRDQFDSVKAGDFFCGACPSNGRGKAELCYWWESELVSQDEVETPTRWRD